MKDILLKDADILDLIQELVSREDDKGTKYFIDTGIPNADGTVQLTNIHAHQVIILKPNKKQEEE